MHLLAFRIAHLALQLRMRKFRLQRLNSKLVFLQISLQILNVFVILPITNPISIPLFIMKFLSISFIFTKATNLFLNSDKISQNILKIIGTKFKLK